MTTSPNILWLRQDLRLSDHPALHAAAKRGGPLLPIFIWEEDPDDHWLPGAAGRYWLHHALEIFEKQLQKLGSTLVLKKGDARKILPALAKELGADTVFWNRRYDPAGSARDRHIQKHLIEQGQSVETFASRLLREPWDVTNEQDQPVRVFTPYWKRCIRDWEPDKPLPAPSKLPPPPKITSARLEDLHLLPRGEARWNLKLDRHWEIGEQAGRGRLRNFTENQGLGGYSAQRNTLAEPGTSSLSPYLNWGHVSPRQIWWQVREQIESQKGGSGGDIALKTSSDPFTRQLFWREFSYSMLVHFPHTPDEPLREEFAHFPWEENEEHFRRWSRGHTGFPIVDAGMNQLWEEGWLHNRARMVVASFLVKDLMIPWQSGAKWFWDTLVDGDLANNTMGWQWVAGSGADSAPYFRIFNPLSQSMRFDPEGHYVRRYVPKLTKFPKSSIHAPWEAQDREELGVSCEEDYPKPMVDHSQTRARALSSYSAMRGK